MCGWGISLRLTPARRAGTGGGSGARRRRHVPTTLSYSPEPFLGSLRGARVEPTTPGPPGHGGRRREGCGNSNRPRELSGRVIGPWRRGIVPTTSWVRPNDAMDLTLCVQSWCGRVLYGLSPLSSINKSHSFWVMNNSFSAHHCHSLSLSPVYRPRSRSLSLSLLFLSLR